MTTWLIHGFNVKDGGKQTVGKLAEHLYDEVEVVDYGWTFLLGLHCTNRKAVNKLLTVVKPGDNIIAHSNGCLLAWHIAHNLKDDLGAIVCINPAIRRDAKWPEDLPVLCVHNHTDWVVQLGRIWGRLFPFDGIETQGWGAAGKYGFTSRQPKVDNWDSGETYWEHPVQGHSGLFKSPEVVYWGGLINKWLHLTNLTNER